MPGTEHFTAWITTDTSALPHGRIDVSVLADEIAGYKGDQFDEPVYQSTGDPLYYAETDVDARDGEREGLIRKVEAMLRDADWTVSGPWEGVETGFVATVERA